LIGDDKDQKNWKREMEENEEACIRKTGRRGAGEKEECKGQGELEEGDGVQEEMDGEPGKRRDRLGEVST